MNRVVHFEIAANDLEKVIAFYKQVFGWKVTRWEGPMPYWLVTTGEDGEGINGAFFKPHQDFTGTVNTIAVASVDDYMQKVKDQGGKVVVDKMTVPGVGYLAYCKDVEGTLFGLHETNPEENKLDRR